MDILDETNDSTDIEVLYEEQVNTYDIQNNTAPSNELTPEVYEFLKEAELNLSDELAELDYERNPQGVIQFINQLTATVVEFNSN